MDLTVGPKVAQRVRASVPRREIRLMDSQPGPPERRAERRKEEARTLEERPESFFCSAGQERGGRPPEPAVAREKRRGACCFWFKGSLWRVGRRVGKRSSTVRSISNGQHPAPGIFTEKPVAIGQRPPLHNPSSLNQIDGRRFPGHSPPDILLLPRVHAEAEELRLPPNPPRPTPSALLQGALVRLGSLAFSAKCNSLRAMSFMPRMI
jgi:hypothetical protein